MTETILGYVWKSANTFDRVPWMVHLCDVSFWANFCHKRGSVTLVSFDEKHGKHIFSFVFSLLHLHSPPCPSTEQPHWQQRQLEQATILLNIIEDMFTVINIIIIIFVICCFSFSIISALSPPALPWPSDHRQIGCWLLTTKMIAIRIMMIVLIFMIMMIMMTTMMVMMMMTNDNLNSLINLEKDHEL